MELFRIIVSEVSDQQMIYLREMSGDRSFAISIGLFEATTISRRVRGEHPMRPLTHDLLKETIDQLGGEPEAVVITELSDHTYYAHLRVRRGDKHLEIDARPSDLIALAVHYTPYLPIYVRDEILKEVCG